MARDAKKGRSPGGKKRAPKRRGSAKRAKKVATKSAGKPARRRAATATGPKARIATLARELSEALERQTATSEILKVIASSSSDVQPVFDAIAESARRVVGGHSVLVTRIVGDHLHPAAFAAESETVRQLLARAYPPGFSQALSSAFVSARVARTGQAVLYADTERDADDRIKEFARARGYRSWLGVPMLRDGKTMGTISVTRVEPGGFDENTLGLMKTFADQAVIAIENARLFNETKEALDRQTATANILKVIASSPDDVQPVFQAIADQSNRLLNGVATAVYSLVDDRFHLVSFTPVSPAADARLKASFPVPATRVVYGESIAKGESFRVVDVEDESMPHGMREIARMRGWRVRSTCRFSATRSPLVRSVSRASNRARLPTTMLSCCGPSPIRPSSRSRTRGSPTAWKSTSGITGPASRPR
jgi:GAF domain-containing protein